MEEHLRRRRAVDGQVRELARTRLRLHRRHHLRRPGLHRRLRQPVHGKNAMCLHEEDHGLAWKHTDLHSGGVESRRSRRFVVNSRDHGRQLRVRLPLVLLHRRADPARGAAQRDHPDRARRRRRQRRRSARDWCCRGWRARTISTCSARGSTSTSTAGATRSSRPRSCRPAVTPGSSRRRSSTPKDPATETPRRDGVGRSSTLRCATRVGEPVGYELVPASTPTMIATDETRALHVAPRSRATRYG